MSLKKIFTWAVLLCVIMTLLSTSYISANNQSEEEIYFNENQKKSLEIDRSIQDRFKKDLSNKIPDDYAGDYIDSDGILNINFVGEDVKSIKDLWDNNNVKLHKVKYSLNHLENIVNSLNKNMYEDGIGSIDLDVINNKVVVSLRKFDDSTVNNLKKIINSPAIEYQKLEDEIYETTTVTFDMTSSSGIYTSIGEYASIGLGVMDSSGNVGFLIPGHISAPLNSSVTYFGGTLGTIKSKVWSTTGDASFVSRIPQWYDDSYSHFYKATNRLSGSNDDTYLGTDSYTSPVGTTVNLYGAVSGKKSGTITNNSYSYSSASGHNYVDQYKVSIAAQSGDSGGPLTRGNEGSRWILGMISTTESSTSNYSKISYILSSLKCSPYQD